MHHPPKPTCQNPSQSFKSRPSTVTGCIPILVSRNLPGYSASDKSSTAITSKSKANDISAHQLPVTISSDVSASKSSSEASIYRPSAVRPNVSLSSTSRSNYQDWSRPSACSSNSSYYQRSNRSRSWNEVPFYRNPTTTSEYEYQCPCSNPCCAPSYDRYAHEPPHVRYKDYPSRYDSYVRYEKPVFDPAFPSYRSKNYDRYPKVPVPRYPATYSQYSSSCGCEEACARPLENSRYEPYPCYEPLSTRLPPRVDKPSKQFKKLPFYDFISELMKPKKLEAFRGFYQQNEFRFKLNEREINTFSRSGHLVEGKWEYKNQVLVRFSLDKNSQLEDKLPPGLAISVNRGAVLVNEFLDEDSTVPRQGPVDISFWVKLKPYKTNKIVISWTDEKKRNHEYVVGIYLARRATCSDLFNRLQVLSRKDYDFAKNVVMDQLSEDAEEEIAMTDLCVSLSCPLGKMRMSTPCRGSECTHLQCFDALMFLQMNEYKPAWNCPVCNKPTAFEDIVIDGYFYEILRSSKLKPETKEVRLSRDGSWDNFVSREEVNKVDKSKQGVIDVSGDSCDDISLVDLVSDEDETLGERRIVKLEPGGLEEDSDGKFSPDLCITDGTVPNSSNYYF